VKFTNRKLSGLQYDKIKDYIDKDAGVENQIIGDERIQKWLNDNPKIAKNHELDKLLLPLKFYEDDLREIIIAFSEANIQADKIERIKDEISSTRIGIELKNKPNNLSKAYFDDVFKSSYQEFEKIEAFLGDPINRLYKKYYDNTVADLQEIIVISRDDYATFDEIFHYLFEYVFQHNIEKLKDSRSLIRIFLHFMYFKCDIGRRK
jgi:hypothetical protein